MIPAVLAQAQSMTRFDTAFVRLVDSALGNPALAVAAVGVAFAVGALHALAPGHGKAIAAAYLVGGRGRARDALLLGVVVAAMHTASVLVLGLGLQLLLAGAGDLPAVTEQVTPILRLVAAVVVVALGGFLVVRQIRRRRRARHAGHDAGEGGHTHELPPDVEPFSRRGLILLGMTGGLLPSPSAFLVLATTSFTGRLWFGLILVAVFSVGLATTLTVIGLAVVRGREALVARLGTVRRQRLIDAAAMAAAAVILLGGLVMTVVALRAL